MPLTRIWPNLNPVISGDEWENIGLAGKLYEPIAWRAFSPSHIWCSVSLNRDAGVSRPGLMCWLPIWDGSRTDSAAPQRVEVSRE
jgi:hypothetical protein